MTTLTFKNFEYNIVYIDPSIETAGDGSSPTTALQTFPGTLSNNTCYLIRRTAKENYAELANMTNANLNNIVFMGMPKDRFSEEYTLLPQEVKDAWGSDTENYANVLANNTLKIVNIKNFSLLNTFFFRNSGVTGTRNSGKSIMFMAWNADSNIQFRDDVNVYIKGCKFGHFYYDMSNPEYLEENETDPNGYNKACMRYMSFQTVGTLEIKDTVFDYSCNLGNDSQIIPLNNYSYCISLPVEFGDTKNINSAFYFAPKKKVILQNLTLNCQYAYEAAWMFNTGYSSHEFMHLLADICTNGGNTISKSSLGILDLLAEDVNCKIKNISINHILHSDCYLPCNPLLICSTSGHLKHHSSGNATDRTGTGLFYPHLDMSDISIQMLKFKNAGPSISYTSIFNKAKPTNTHLAKAIFERDASHRLGSIILHGVFEGTIKNITADLTYAPTMSVLTIDNYAAINNNCADGKNLTIKNVHVTTAQSEEEIVYKTQDWNDSYIINVLHHEFRSANDTVGMRNRPSLNPIYLENIYINSPYGGALNLTNAEIKDSAIIGNVKLGYKTKANLNSLTNCCRHKPAVYIDDEYNDIEIKNLIFDHEKAWGNIANIQQIKCNNTLDKFYGNSTIIVENSNALCFEENLNTDSQCDDHGIAVCINHGQSGQFLQLTKNGKINSCSVVREGSSAEASLRFLLDGINQEGFVQSVKTNQRSTFEIFPNKIGQFSLSFYLLSENQLDATDLTEKFIIETKHIEEDGMISLPYSHETLEDNSTWTGLAGGYAYKITQQLNITSTENPLEINITNGISGKGAIYLDPDIKVEEQVI